jgi:signal transduction histidine kinase
LVRQIELVILNLAINARDAMPDGGMVTIATDNRHRGPPLRAEEPPEGDYVAVTVRDVGTGMTPEVLAKAFEPFFTTKGPGAGSGLGLSQVFGTAHQSGGGVQIDSVVGQGTSVSVFLPRTTVPVRLAVVGSKPVKLKVVRKVRVTFVGCPLAFSQIHREVALFGI